MKKHSKLFSTLLVFLLCLDLVAPVAQAMASTDGQVDGFTGLEASPSYEADGGETVENTAVVSQEEPTTEQNDQQVTVDTNINETAVHPTDQTQGEVVQQENTETQVTIDAQEEEVVEEPSLEEDEAREVQGMLSSDFRTYIDSVSYAPSTINAGDMTTLTLSFSEKNGYTLQAGQTLTYNYPSNITGMSATVPLNFNGEDLGTCTSSSASVTCTFNSNVEKYDNVQGHFTFKATGKTGLGEGETPGYDDYGNTVTVVTGASGSSTDTFFYKTGVLDDRTTGEVIWDLTVNAAGTYRPNGDVVVQDTFGPGQELKGDILVEGTTNYTLNKHSNGFTLTLHHGASDLKTVRISYTTKVTEAGKYLDRLTNAYSIEYEMMANTQVPHESESKSGVASVENAVASGGITGTLPASGIARIVKIDEATGNFLDGAVFGLYKEDGTKIQDLTTVAGIAETSVLSAGSYYFQEIAAPVGYELSEAQYNFTIDQNAVEGIEKVATNKAIPSTCTDFTLVVKDGNKEDSNFVEGATVTKDGVEVGQTDANGKLVIDEPLTPGQDYEFVISKDGETKKVTIKGDADNCQFEVVLEQPAPKTCDYFTVTVVEKGDVETTIAGAEVVITDENGEEFATGTTGENGQFNTDKPLEVGTNYTVTVTVDGYDVVTKTVTGSTEDCGTKVSVTKTPVKDVCENFTVNTEDGSKVTITDKEGKVIEEGTVEGGKFVTEKPLEPGKDYTVTVEKDGYDKETVEVKGSEDNCEITVELTETPEEKPEEKVCEDFTVNTEDGSKVTITDKETNEVISEGTVEGGKFVTAKPLEPGKDYTVTVEKDGYETATEKVTGSEDNCEITVELKEKPTGGGGGESPDPDPTPTEPEHPEKPEPEEPEQPTNVCEDFTVNTEDGSKVTITDKETNEVISEGTVEGGKFVTAKPLEPGKDYTVTVEKDGYETATEKVKGSEDNCEITVELTPVKDVCENFTVNTEDGSKVTITDKEGNVVEEGTVENGKFVTAKPLEPGKDYTVTVEKDGYDKETVEVKGSEKDCEVTVELTETPVGKVCEDFTVETERYAKVVIKDSEGNVFAEGKADKDGKFVTDKPLVKDETYTVTVTKTGYRKVEETVIGSEADCSIELPMKRRPSGGGGGGTPTDPTEPSNPTDPENEKDKPEVVEPETPGTETPETPETETPETPETPETETPEGETPETPEVDEKDKPEVVENDKTPGKPSQPSVNEQDKPSVVDNAGSKTKPSVSKPGQNAVQGETLPQTGEEQYLLFLGLGLFLVLFGAGMTYRSRKQA